MFYGVQLVRAIDDQQQHGDDPKSFRINPVEQIIKHRCQQIYDGQASEAECEQSFGADPAIEIKEVAGIVSPAPAAVRHLQIP